MHITTMKRDIVKKTGTAVRITWKGAVLCAAMVLSVAGQAQAGLVDIRIDLGGRGGQTGGNWNNISSLTGLTPNLIDFNTSLGTGVSMSGAGGSPWEDFFGDTTSALPSQSWFTRPAAEDGAGMRKNQTGVFTFAGLTDSSSYQVEVISVRTRGGQSFNYRNTITVEGNLASRTYRGTPVQTPWVSTHDGLAVHGPAVGNWLIWDNVAPVGGAVRIANSPDDTNGIINAIRILEVPEPTSLALLGLGSAVMLCRRRKYPASCLATPNT